MRKMVEYLSWARSGVVVFTLFTIVFVLVLSYYIDMSSTVAISMISLTNHSRSFRTKDQELNPLNDRIRGTRGGEFTTISTLGLTLSAPSQLNYAGKNDSREKAERLKTVPRPQNNKPPPSSPSPSQTKSLDFPTTKMTFDKNVVVRCKESPYVDCYPPGEIMGNSSQTFRIAFLRHPRWIGAMSFDKCQYRNCFSDGHRVNEKTDLVIVNAVYLGNHFQLPRRWNHQRYAAATWESPPHTKASFLQGPSKWNDQFNLTITYRVDADIFVPYDKLLWSPKPLEERPNYYELAKNKTKMVAWFVSNCRAASRRGEYVKEMQKYIDVDIYGLCGKPCERGPHSPCMEALPYTYKFYLSFENSLCTHYVTEKLFKLFAPNMHIIPVVRGNADYAKYFPDNSLVNAANFPNAKALALYLKELGSDFKAYSRYLEYKDLYVNTGNIPQRVYCDICKYLNTQKREPKIYDMKKWMGDGHCSAAKDIT